MEFSHINTAGEANMVDVGAKDQTERSALASGVVLMRSETLTAIKEDGLAKGEVLAVARIFGIQAAKVLRSYPALSPTGVNQGSGQLRNFQSVSLRCSQRFVCAVKLVLKWRHSQQ